MKKKLTTFALLINFLAFSQVGINTQSPTETFDVNGTARIWSLPLNGTANAIYTKPDGTKSLTKDQTFTATTTLVANSNGVVGTLNYLPGQYPIIIVGADGADAVTTSSIASSRNGTAGSTSTIITKNFTLTKKSLVTFSFNLSVGDIFNYNGNPLTDGVSKRIGANLFLNGTRIINAGNSFTSTAGGLNYVTGYFYLNGARVLILNAGSYTVTMNGNVFAWNGDMVGVQANFGSTTDDALDIVAIPME